MQTIWREGLLLLLLLLCLLVQLSAEGDSEHFFTNAAQWAKLHKKVLSPKGLKTYLVLQIFW